MATSIPRLWPGATVAICASGPSLTSEDVDRLRDRVKVVAVNDAVRLAPWADVLYSSDFDWWRRAGGAPSFLGLKFALEYRRGHGGKHFKAWPEITVLRNSGAGEFDEDPTGLRHYRNSGGAAIALAVHLGASRILLLGYDMAPGPGGRKHFHGGQHDGSPYDLFCRRIASIAPILAAKGIAVLNCSRQTRLGCFPRASLDEALAAVPVATEAAA